MEKVRVVVHIDAPVEPVFAAVSDHVAFLTNDDTTATILRPGDIDRNGLGCVREVRVGRRARYIEEITAWEPPTFFEYTIRETSLPLRHRGSRIELKAWGGGTDVTWTAQFEITVPIVGGLLGSRISRRLTTAFTNFLLATKTRLESR